MARIRKLVFCLNVWWEKETKNRREKKKDGVKARFWSPIPQPCELGMTSLGYPFYTCNSPGWHGDFVSCWKSLRGSINGSENWYTACWRSKWITLVIHDLAGLLTQSNQSLCDRRVFFSRPSNFTFRLFSKNLSYKSNFLIMGQCSRTFRTILIFVQPPGWW